MKIIAYRCQSIKSLIHMAQIWRTAIRLAVDGGHWEFVHPLIEAEALHRHVTHWPTLHNSTTLEACCNLRCPSQDASRIVFIRVFLWHGGCTSNSTWPCCRNPTASLFYMVSWFFSLTEVYSESFWVYSVHWRICDLHWRLPWKKVRCRPGRQGSAWHVGHVDICSPESRVWRPGSVWNWGIGTWKVGIRPRAAAVGRCPGAQGRLGVVALDWWARLLDWLGIGIIGSYGMVYIAPSSDIPQICWPHPEQANWAQHSKMQSNWRTPSDWKDLIGHRTGLRWVMGQVMQLIANDIQIHPGWPRKKWCDKCAGSLYVPINVRSTGCVGGNAYVWGPTVFGISIHQTWMNFRSTSEGHGTAVGLSLCTRQRQGTW